MLDEAFAALKSYDWGTDRAPLAAIDQAVISTRDDQSARSELETKLAALLREPVSRDAKDYACRKLMIVGTAAAVPALAELLTNAELSHMGRYALERIPVPEAGEALRQALAGLAGAQLVGVIASLGGRRDEPCIPTLAKLITNNDVAVARAAACALGDIGTAAADGALGASASLPTEVQPAVADARLACAEKLLDQDQKSAALAIFKSLTGDRYPKHVRLAGRRGMLACAGKAE